MDEVSYSPDEPAYKFLTKLGLFKSNSDAKRAFEQGAVEIRWREGEQTESHKLSTATRAWVIVALASQNRFYLKWSKKDLELLEMGNHLI